MNGRCEIIVDRPDVADVRDVDSRDARLDGLLSRPEQMYERIERDGRVENVLF